MFGHIIRYAASMLPMPFPVRGFLYKLSGIRMGSKVTIDRDVQFTMHKHVKIGDRVTLAKSVSLLGNITTVHSHLEQKYSMNRTRDIVIEDDVYIGVKATVLPGIKIGRMATIGANTLVTRNVPPYAIVLGVPGRVYGFRENSEQEKG